jgi:hypothetical protein
MGRHGAANSEPLALRRFADSSAIIDLAIWSDNLEPARDSDEPGFRWGGATKLAIGMSESPFVLGMSDEVCR